MGRRVLYLLLITLLYTHKRKTTMDSISIRYSLKWQHKTHTHYQWSNCGKLFNVKSGRQVKKVLNGGSIGYWIAGNFITLKELRSQIQSIEKEYCPF